jgi:hypothetical protein
LPLGAATLTTTLSPTIELTQRIMSPSTRALFDGEPRRDGPAVPLSSPVGPSSLDRERPVCARSSLFIVWS